MNKNMRLLLNYMKQYIYEPNAPDYSGEYPPCWEITQEEVNEILNYIYQLQQENQQLKEQLKFERQCQNRFFKVNNKSYDGRIVLEQLKQRDEVIEEAINHLDCFISDTNLSKYDTLKILMYTKKVLQKYRKDSKCLCLWKEDN